MIIIGEIKLIRKHKELLNLLYQKTMENRDLNLKSTRAFKQTKETKL